MEKIIYFIMLYFISWRTFEIMSDIPYLNKLDIPWEKFEWIEKIERIIKKIFIKNSRSKIYDFIKLIDINLLILNLLVYNHI